MLRTHIHASVEIVVPQIPRLTGQDDPAAASAHHKPYGNLALETCPHLLMFPAVAARVRLRSWHLGQFVQIGGKS
jgi:hypothetical protein